MLMPVAFEWSILQSDWYNHHTLPIGRVVITDVSKILLFAIKEWIY